jgi:hypothetical protein
LLELWTRHHAVLNGEDGQQHQIDDQRQHCGSRRSAVDGLRHHQIFNETDGVEEGDEEYGVGHDAIEERNNPSEDIALAAPGRIECLDLAHGSLRCNRGDCDRTARSMPGLRSKNFARSLICP